MELEIGIARMERRDVRQGQRLRTWMEHYVMPEFSGRILPVDAVVARRCAHLHVPDTRPDRDAYIAGTAMVHAMTLITRNITDFAAMPVSVLNPWDAPPG